MSKELNKYAKLTKSFQYKETYCGCCGMKISQFEPWCLSCIPHIDGKSMKPPWERTYFALTGEDCPFLIKGE